MLLICAQYNSQNPQFINYGSSHELKTKNKVLTHFKNQSEYILFLEEGDHIENLSALEEFLKITDADLIALPKNSNFEYVVCKNDGTIKYRYPIFEQPISYGGKRVSFSETTITSQIEPKIEKGEEYLKKRNSIFLRYMLCQRYLKNNDYKKVYYHAKFLTKTKHKKRFNPLIFEGYLFLGLSTYHLGEKHYKHFFLSALKYAKKRDAPPIYLTKATAYQKIESISLLSFN